MKENELVILYQAMNRMDPGVEGYDAFRKKILVEISKKNDQQFSNFLGKLPPMYGGRGDKREVIIRPSEAKLILKNKYHYD